MIRINAYSFYDSLFHIFVFVLICSAFPLVHIFRLDTLDDSSKCIIAFLSFSFLASFPETAAEQRPKVISDYSHPLQSFLLLHNCLSNYFPPHEWQDRE